MDFDEEAEIFHGEVINVKDVITFEAKRMGKSIYLYVNEALACRAK